MTPPLTSFGHRLWLRLQRWAHILRPEPGLQHLTAWDHLPSEPPELRKAQPSLRVCGHGHGWRNGASFGHRHGPREDGKHQRRGPWIFPACVSVFATHPLASVAVNVGGKSDKIYTSVLIAIPIQERKNQKRQYIIRFVFFSVYLFCFGQMITFHPLALPLHTCNVTGAKIFQKFAVWFYRSFFFFSWQDHCITVHVVTSHITDLSFFGMHV